MSDTEPTAPAARPRPPRRRSPPSTVGASNGHTDPVVAELLARIEQLEQPGRMPYVPASPQPRAAPTAVDPRSLSPWLQELLADTHEVTQPEPEPGFNIPPRRYLKPDGSVVQLQGDAKSRAYYVDKGFRVLSRDEEKRYLEHEHPRLLADQRRKAHLVGSLRKLIEREPQLMGYVGDNEWDNGLSSMTIAELEEEWERLIGYSVNPSQKLPRQPRFREAAPEEAMKGVETIPPRGYMPNGRTIEVTSTNARSFA